MSDNINPDHYKTQTSLECIEAMELVFGPTAVADFCVCNAWKYIWRWRNKNGLEDLKKARWYLNRAEKYLYGPRPLIANMENYIHNELNIREE